MTRAPVPVRVVTELIDDHDSTRIRYVEESTKLIDHNDSSDRKWLGSHCFWAMRNKRRVTTTPVSESR